MEVRHMLRVQNQQPLKALTVWSSLMLLLRTLYRMRLDYCVLPPMGDFANVIVFTKDQLISLIERGNSDASIAEIPKRVAQGLFKPVAIFRSDSSFNDFVSKEGFAEPERLQALVVEEEGAKISSLKEALAPRVPEFPAWWEAPMPFAMCGYGKLHVNRTAMLMFGPDLKRMSVHDIPDKNEFLVTLEGGSSRCSVTFRRLEGDIFALEDSTSDIEAAEEVTWWAAIGKAWVATLDREKRPYRRCDKEEAESIRAADGSLVLSCDWEGELLGYFCVENSLQDQLDKAPTPQIQVIEQLPRKKRRPRKDKKNLSRQEEQQKNEPGKTAHNDALNALGPQTLGLLAPGQFYFSDSTKENAEQANNSPSKKAGKKDAPS
jgi:hypothetical protein